MLWKLTKCLVIAFTFLATAAFAQNITAPSSGCPANETCSGHGICFPNEDTCVCDKGYLSLPNESPCGYEQKSLLTAALLQTFAGFSGAAYWYIERYGYASGQLILFLSLAPLGIATWSVFKADDVPTRTKALVTSIAIADLLGGFVWWAVEISRFAKDEVSDGKGQPLFGANSN